MEHVVKYAAFCVIAMMATTNRAAEIKLRERVAPKSPVVRLADVADVVSADRQEVRQLMVVPLMPAPAAETERFLRRREIADMLAAGGVELGNLRFTGAEQVAVMGRRIVPFSGAGRIVGSSTAAAGDRRLEALAGAAPAMLDADQAAALAARLNRTVEDYIKLNSGSKDIGRVECSASSRQLAQLALATTEPMCDGGKQPYTGRQKFTVSFATADGPARFPVYADVSEPAAPVVVTRRAVGRGNVITAADVEVQMLEPNGKTRGSRAVIDSLDKAIGMEARQAVQVGEILFVDQVQSPIVVKRGELITVRTEAGGLRVRTTAKALEDGAIGKLIQVESVEGKQRFDARVVGLRQASVFTPTNVNVKPATTQVDTATRLQLNAPRRSGTNR